MTGAEAFLGDGRLDLLAVNPRGGRALYASACEDTTRLPGLARFVYSRRRQLPRSDRAPEERCGVRRSVSPRVRQLVISAGETTDLPARRRARGQDSAEASRCQSQRTTALHVWTGSSELTTSPRLANSRRWASVSVTAKIRIRRS